jgi:taurine dioxygenase
MNNSYKKIQVEPIAEALGAEISGVDLSNLDTDSYAEIRQAFRQYSVIFFRDQVLSPDQHVAFAERWGEININRFFKPLDTHPKIATVIKEPDQTVNIGGNWHTDHSYDQIPALGSILLAREVPPIGGDTHFSSMYKAYDALSPGLQKTLESLSAWHSSRHAFGKMTVSDDNKADDRLSNSDLATQDALHPVIIAHPETGRKALYVNADFTVKIDGWTEQESKPLLEYLYTHGQRAEFTCTFQWQKHSIAIWDNRATWHNAVNDYHGYRRVMHRITLDGVPLRAAASVQ